MKAHGRARRVFGLTLALAGALLAVRPNALALDPSLDISQYAHRSWKVRDGFTKGAIYSIAQTNDGYLWLGSEFGLVRFDGARALPWQPQDGQQLPSSNIGKLVAARDGTLWIGTTRGLASLKNGKLTNYSELAGFVTVSLLEDREGSIWIAAWGLPTGRLCRFDSGKVSCYGADGSFGTGVTGLYEDSKGNLWAGVINGLWRWQPGVSEFHAIPGEGEGIRVFAEDDDGTLLLETHNGLRRFVNGRLESYPASMPSVHVSGILRDRDGGLWIGTSTRGLNHAYRGETTSFNESDGLAGDNVYQILEDREGNVWTAGDGGIDRFRVYPVTAVTIKQGLSSNVAWSVLADGQIVWVGTLNGLNQINDERVRTIGSDGKLNGEAPDFLFKDHSGTFWISTLRNFGFLKNDRFNPLHDWPGGHVHSVVEDRPGSLWIANQALGLFHIVGDSVVQHIPWTGLGQSDYATAIVADPLRGGLWLGFRNGKLAQFVAGAIRATYTPSSGLGEGITNALKLDQDGTLWIATEGGLSHLNNDSISTITSKNGLPCDGVHWITEDDDHSFWLYMPCGLIRITHSELEAWIHDPKRKIQAGVFDSSDGVRSRALAGGFGPKITKSADGKLWFSTDYGVSVIDPRHLPVNKLPPPVHIEQITADGKTYDPTRSLRLPPRAHDLTIDYTALSLVAPEKVHFRFKLEGQDKDWREVINDREVQYSNLAPRNYRFRVLACNNSGVWNEEGASLDFVIPPMWYQTNWFRTLCAVAFLGLLWALYELRLRQVAQQFNLRLEGRVGERTRIARELHDTLLQSFQGVLMKLHAITYSRDLDETQHTLKDVIKEARQAITEGRDAVQGLRSSTVVTNDLAEALNLLGKELAAQCDGNRPEFSVDILGTPHDLVPLLRDEVYRITSEALRNAFRHAQARRIEIEIRYDQRQLRLRVRDDGKGIEAEVLKAGGRVGHYGLPSMRERAKLIGGKLAVWSELESGTETELTIPASIAYAKPETRRLKFWRKGA